MNVNTNPLFRLEFVDAITDVDANVAAIVHCSNGKSFGITFFTKKNISKFCEKWKETGECLNGSYFWAIDGVIVEKLEYALLEQIVSDMLEFDDNSYDTLERHFTRISEEASVAVDISANPQFRLDLIHRIDDVDDDNIDAIIHFDNGESFGITFFTKKNVSTLCDKWKETGESLNGSYFWATDWIIVEKLEIALLTQVVADMINRYDSVFEKYFTRIEPTL